MDDIPIIPAISEDDSQIEYGDSYDSSFDDFGTFDDPDFGSSDVATPTVDNLNFTLMDLVQMAVVYAFIIAAGLSAIYIFIGGMSFILSGGNDEKVKQAINTIRYSIIGLVVTILSFTFVTIVGRMFGLNFMNYLSYGKVKNSINKLLSQGSTDNESSNFEIRQ